MNETVRNYCQLAVFNDCFDDVSERIYQKIKGHNSGLITVELTEYVLYCIQILEHNGCPASIYGDEILVFMWQVCPATALLLLGLPNTEGRWRIEQDGAYLDIKIVE